MQNMSLTGLQGFWTSESQENSSEQKTTFHQKKQQFPQPLKHVLVLRICSQNQVSQIAYRPKHQEEWPMPVMTKISPKITQKKVPTNSLVGKQQNRGYVKQTQQQQLRYDFENRNIRFQKTHQLLEGKKNHDFDYYQSFISKIT